VEEGFTFWYLMVPVVMAIALPSALRNHRTGRGDRKSAVRFAAIVGCLLLAYGLLSGHFTATRLDWKPFNLRLAIAVWVGVVTWVLYIAIEPVARRVYPESLISWTRLLSGGFRDPLVGRDLLLGMLSSGAIYLLTAAGFWLDGRSDEPWRWLFALRGFHGVRFVLADLAGAAYSSLNQSMMLMTLVILLWALTRNRWIAWAGLFVLAQALVMGAPHRDFRTLFLWAALLVIYTTISHAGFLAFVCAGITNHWLVVSRLMLDDSGWFSTNAYVAGVLWLATAGYGFYIALAGRRILQRSPLALADE
jgi:serine/threonine-protein kinase